MKRFFFTALFVLMVSPTVAADRFEQMDTNEDGSVTWEEFSAALPSMKQKAFETIDADKDGRLSRMEWSAFSSQHGMKMNGSAMSATPSENPGQSVTEPGRMPLVKPPKP